MARHRLIHSKFSVDEKGIVRRHSPNYNFIGDRNNGTTFRWGRYLKEDPKSSPWPELADISISNKCSKGCGFCYRDSTTDGGLMTLGQYSKVLDQLTSPVWGPPFQVALGGGEPTEHPHLIQILKETQKRQIIANLTTNGYSVSREHIEAFKKLCGAVAISTISINPELQANIQKLISAEIRTNLHFVLSESSIELAIDILRGKFDPELKGLNAIVFLTHKTMGRANSKDNLQSNKKLEMFLSLIDKSQSKLRFGFDACFVPLLLKYTNIDQRFVDSCECGFFSVYVDEKLNVKPCSFAKGDEWTFDLSRNNFANIWEIKFEPYRNAITRSCTINCGIKDCRGGCLFHESLNLCKA